MVPTLSRDGNPTVGFEISQTSDDAPLAYAHFGGDSLNAGPTFFADITRVVCECEQNDKVGVYGRSVLPHERRQLDAHAAPAFALIGSVVCCRHIRFLSEALAAWQPAGALLRAGGLYALLIADAGIPLPPQGRDSIQDSIERIS
jgi:hypothetical protein